MSTSNQKQRPARRSFLNLAAGMTALAGVSTTAPAFARARQSGARDAVSGIAANMAPPVSSVPAVEHRIPHDGHMIHALDYPGQEPAFVMLHGFPDNLHIYDYIVPLLTAAGRRVVVFDFLGFGQSDKINTPGYYSFNQQIGDLGAVVDGLKLDKFVLVGHDSGGPCAANYALDNPRRIAWLCLMNTYYADSPTNVLPELIELFGDPQLSALAMAFASDREKMGWLINFQKQRFQVNMPPELKQRYDGILQPIVDANFVGGSAPAFIQMTAQVRPSVVTNTRRLPMARKFAPKVKLVWGSLDPYLTPAAAKVIAANFPHSSVKLIPAGHWLMIDLPDQTAKLLLEGV